MKPAPIYDKVKRQPSDFFLFFFLQKVALLRSNVASQGVGVLVWSLKGCCTPSRGCEERGYFLGRSGRRRAAP